jgi:aromatic ring-opening dioxygenase catalytic subunit (LigB family)
MDRSRVVYLTDKLTSVMSYENNHLLYDYYGFPEEMYKVKFESKGSPAVASRIVELLKQVAPLNQF